MGLLLYSLTTKYVFLKKMTFFLKKIENKKIYILSEW